MSSATPATPAPPSLGSDGSLPGDLQSAPVYTAYPKMWVGFALLAICWLMQLAAARTNGQEKDAFATTGLLAGFGGYGYWLFCVYRIHKILAEYMEGKYPIAPWKSVVFQFIPFYSWYWLFKWPATLADYVNARAGTDGNARHMRSRIPSVALLTASLCGFGPAIGFQLLLFFATGLYLNHNLKRVLPRPEPISLRRLEQLKVSASVGIGAAFSLVMFEALHEFFSSVTPWIEKAHQLFAICLVSIGVIIFLEPLFDKLRVLLGVAPDHPVLESRRSIWLRVAVFGILVSTSLLHGIAHTTMDKWMEDPAAGPRKLMALAAALVISGGVTYFWIGAAHRRPSHAARSGAFSGAALAALVFLLLSSVASPGTAAVSMNGSAIVHHVALPGVPSIVTEQIESGVFPTRALLALTVPWLLIGFSGGAVFDKRWAHCCALNLVISIVGAGIVAGLLLRFFGGGGWAEAFSHLPAVAGWVLSLIVCCSPITLGLEEASARSFDNALGINPA